MFTTALRNTREEQGLSLRTLAKRSGVAHSNISAIEHGRRIPTTATIEQLAHTLGVTFIAVPAAAQHTAESTSAVIVEAANYGQHGSAYRRFLQFSDDLGRLDPTTRVIVTASAPAPSTHRWVDAVAALAEYRLTEVGAPLPTWVRNTAGYPEAPWEPQRSELLLPKISDPSNVAEPFLRRGVLIEESELASV